MQQDPDIFQRLRNGETVAFDDPEFHKLRELQRTVKELAGFLSGH